MDDTTLRQTVRDAAFARVNSREAFTTVHISKPIIEDVDSSVRHGAVRAILNDLTGEIQDEDFVVSIRTAYVGGDTSRPVNVRVWHPDDPMFDLDDWCAKEMSLKINRPAKGPQLSQPQAVAGLACQTVVSADTDDADQQDDNVVAITSTPQGAKVSLQCKVQPKQSCLNVPRVLVAKAGWAVGDELKISADGTTIKIQRAKGCASDPPRLMWPQKVDQEGRVRLYGDRVTALPSTSCSALLVESDAGEKFIQVQ